jgi:hypothetical protein
MDLGVGQASVVVDAHERDLIACTSAFATSITVDPVPYGFDTSQLLRIDMEQIAWGRMLVSTRWIQLFFEPPDPTDAFSLQMLRHGRDRHVEFASDFPARFASPAQPDHALHEFSGRQFWQAVRSTASVFETLGSAFSKAIQPLMDCLAAHACGASRFGHGPAFFLNSMDEQETSLWSQLRVTMELHLGLLSEGMVWFRNPISSDWTSGVNNVFGPHT